MIKTKKPLSLTQQAGMLCTNKQFWQYGLFKDSSEAAVFIRNSCGITSRKELVTNLIAASKFILLLDKFNAWKTTNQYAENISRMD